MIRPRRVSLAACAALALSIQPLFAGQSARRNNIDRAVAQALASGARTVRVILTMQPGFRDGVRQALKKHGDVIKSEHPSIEAIAALVHSEDVPELANYPGIRSVSADAPVAASGGSGESLTQSTSSLTSSTSTTSVSTLRETLGLPAKPSPTTLTGAGITVAIIDSGIDGRIFAKRITAFYDFTQGGIPTQAYDDFGHGTHIAGLIGEASSPYIGVAPDVNFVGLKVLDKYGQGSTSDVIKALEYLTVNRNRLGVQIVNLSLGHPIFAPASQDPLVAAVEQASHAGLIVVVSAGNFGINQKTGEPGYTGITSPGNSPSALTVGATDTRNTITRDDDVVAAFSSRGPSWFDGYAKPDFVAPGANLVSDASSGQTLFTSMPSAQIHIGSHDYLQLSGTSMAAAVTTGVAALILDANNRAGYYGATPLAANAVKAILEYSAIHVAGFDVLTQGTGQINANGAIALASAINTGAEDGAYWLGAGVPEFSLIGGVLYDWSKQIVWGNQLLTGNALYYDLKTWSESVEWGDNIVWGTLSSDDNIVWGTAAGGDNIVWGTSLAGDNIVWGTNIVWADRLIGQLEGDNIVWGTCTDGDNIVWGTIVDDNIVWGTFDGDNIVWGTMDGDNIVWGTALDGDNIVWGTFMDADNIVWGTNDKGGIF